LVMQKTRAPKIHLRGEKDSREKKRNGDERRKNFCPRGRREDSGLLVAPGPKQSRSDEKTHRPPRETVALVVKPAGTIEHTAIAAPRIEARRKGDGRQRKFVPPKKAIRRAAGEKQVRHDPRKTR